jgi:hypothetical protein
VLSGNSENQTIYHDAVGFTASQNLEKFLWSAKDRVVFHLTAPQLGAFGEDSLNRQTLG